MANTVGDFARQGRRMKSDPGAVVKMAFWAGVGLSIIGGIVIAVWRGLGGRVSDTVSNVGRGIMALGQQTVESGDTAGPGFLGEL